MNRTSKLLPLSLAAVLPLLAGCGDASGPPPLSDENINLVFVVSQDLTDNAPGDINPATTNLTGQGLQRSLMMASYLKNQLLGGKNVNRIYAVAPMTHLQLGIPDMVALGSIQHFAMLNEVTLTAGGGSGTPVYTDHSYPINVVYRPDGGLPTGVVSPLGTPARDVAALLPTETCPGCQGLIFGDPAGNLALVESIVRTGIPGSFVFSAPWSTTRALLADLAARPELGLVAPTAYAGPNVVHVLTITPAGVASLATWDSKLKPSSTYPVLPSTLPAAACPGADTPTRLFTLSAAAGDPGVVVPAGMNRSETMYMVRHVEAHAFRGWEDGNFVAAGQWRALGLANALKGKIDPTLVYSIDPAQVADGAQIPGNTNSAYVRPALTLEPYVVANGLPMYLVYEFQLGDTNSPAETSDKFFKGGAFSGERVLLAWEHAHFPPIVSALLANYFPDGGAPAVPSWPSDDYDQVWSVTLDSAGNLTVNNALCEGIDSAKLALTAPEF